jgi:alternate signal-mediated exported protein
VKRTSKAATALGAATLLMVSGVGSLAYWQVEQQSGGFSFKTGYMGMVKLDDSETWSLNEISKTKTELANVKLVPLDKIEYRQVFTISGNGDNLHLAPHVQLGEITVPDQFGNLDKKSPITPNHNLQGLEQTSVERTITSDTYNVTLNENGVGHIALVITLNWPSDEENPLAANTNETNNTLTLDKTVFTLSQVPKPLDPSIGYWRITNA